MTRSKLSIKAVLVAGGLSVAALTGSLPAVAQEYTCPGGYMYDPSYGCTVPEYGYAYDYGYPYGLYYGGYGWRHGFDHGHGFGHGMGGGFGHGIGAAQFGGGFHGGGGGHR
jgi:hypothetical protein